MLYRFQLRSSATDAAPKVTNEGGGGRGTLREQSWASPGQEEDSPVGDRYQDHSGGSQRRIPPLHVDGAPDTTLMLRLPRRPGLSG